MKKGNYTIALVAATIALVFFVASFFFEQTVLSDTQVGASFFPRMLSLLLLFLSALLAWFTWKSAPREDGKNPRPLFQSSSFIPFTACLCIIAYLAILERAGFILSTFLVNLALLFLFRVRKPLVLASVPLLFTVFTYFVFSKLLMVPLPEGILYF